jgi:hypothetical protein
MPRVCTICTHQSRRAIEQALVAGEPFRNIASRFGTSTAALKRHKDDHLPGKIVQAKAAQEVVEADDLLGQVQSLKARAMSLLDAAEAQGDIRTALTGIRETRACLELLFEVEGKLDRRPQVNLVYAPQWIAMRTAILLALRDHPDAAQAVAAVLAEGEGVSHHHAV